VVPNAETVTEVFEVEPDPEPRKRSRIEAETVAIMPATTPSAIEACQRGAGRGLGPSDEKTRKAVIPAIAAHSTAFTATGGALLITCDETTPPTAPATAKSGDTALPASACG
jgi:hypothetical protein